MKAGTEIRTQDSRIKASRDNQLHYTITLHCDAVRVASSNGFFGCGLISHLPLPPKVPNITARNH